MESRTAKFIKECAESAGVEIISMKQGKKHIKVIVEKGGKGGLVIVSVSPHADIGHSVKKDMMRVCQ